MSCKPGSLPPRLAKRRALSLSTNARNPSRTNAAFPETPVNFCASASKSSSIFNVVLIIHLHKLLNMHHIMHHLMINMMPFVVHWQNRSIFF
jgi:hypothetical protein